MLFNWQLTGHKQQLVEELEEVTSPQTESICWNMFALIFCWRALNNEEISKNQSPLWIIYEQEQNKVSYELQRVLLVVVIGLWNSINA